MWCYERCRALTLTANRKLLILSVWALPSANVKHEETAAWWPSEFLQLIVRCTLSISVTAAGWAVNALWFIITASYKLHSKHVHEAETTTPPLHIQSHATETFITFQDYLSCLEHKNMMKCTKTELFCMGVKRSISFWKVLTMVWCISKNLTLGIYPSSSVFLLKNNVSETGCASVFR
jgi:hypothetical protein